MRVFAEKRNSRTSKTLVLGMATCAVLGLTTACQKNEDKAPEEKVAAATVIEEVELELELAKSNDRCFTTVEEVQTGIKLRQYKVTMSCDEARPLSQIQQTRKKIDALTYSIKQKLNNTIGSVSDLGLLNGYEEALKKANEALFKAESKILNSATDASLNQELEHLRKVGCEYSKFQFQCIPSNSLSAANEQISSLMVTAELLTSPIQLQRMNVDRGTIYDNLSRTILSIKDRKTELLPETIKNLAENLQNKFNITIALYDVFTGTWREGASAILDPNVFNVNIADGGGSFAAFITGLQEVSTGPEAEALLSDIGPVRILFCTAWDDCKKEVEKQNSTIVIKGDSTRDATLYGSEIRAKLKEYKDAKRGRHDIG